MANHKSAIKRARQNEIRRLRNKSTKTRLKNVIKDMNLAGSESSQQQAVQKFTAAQSALDKAAQKGVIHKKTASRKISRMTKKLHAAIKP